MSLPRHELWLFMISDLRPLYTSDPPKYLTSDLLWPLTPHYWSFLPPTSTKIVSDIPITSIIGFSIACDPPQSLTSDLLWPLTPHNLSFWPLHEKTLTSSQPLASPWPLTSLNWWNEGDGAQSHISIRTSLKARIYSTMRVWLKTNTACIFGQIYVWVEPVYKNMLHIQYSMKCSNT